MMMLGHMHDHSFSQQFHCILQQIIIEIFIDVKHEMQEDLLGCHQSLRGHINRRNVSVLVVGFNHC